MNIWKIYETVAFASLFATTLAFHAVPSAEADRQPQMRDALRSLSQAVNHLDKATADKGGYRVSALRLTRQAIAEVEKGIAYDNKR